jgi:LacI family transcriptional regulator
MLRADPDIDAVICGSIVAAFGAVVAAEKRGHVIGKSFDIFAKEALPLLELFRPGIVAISEDVTRAGQFLAKAAIARIAQPQAPPLQDLEVPT